ncbi:MULTISPECIES: bifunctional lytic transglycosylase/C40 family peptidase [Halobacillus]|uniref:bifunctional lytic transglycosylase/C40 family peptidase n=1 Tax=Halobacillus TaxID=45667 RepID=UPI0009A74A6B|nr:MULTISPECIES: bifunctional lytic transglycosylase/C40 family peptidase [Halobacillus]
MSAVATVKGAMIAKKHWKKAVYAFLILILLLASAALGLKSEQQPNYGNVGTIHGKAQVPDYIAKWRPLLETYTEKYGVAEYTEFLLALMAQELGASDTLDIMQASESLGLPPNTIQDPIRSVQVGVQYFADLLQRGEEAGVDFKTIVQSYNFGVGYIDFIAEHGGKHTPELAKTFAQQQAKRLGWDDYGDPQYLVHVMENLTGGNNQGNTNIKMADNATLQNILDNMVRFEGDPYVWAGASPSVGFDCSGLMMWAFGQAGINIPRTAQTQYVASMKIPPGQAQVGDLVFFTGTYETQKHITHVGIYVGNGKMFNANGSGIEFSNLNSSYWSKHFVGFGRIANF